MSWRNIYDLLSGKIEVNSKDKIMMAIDYLENEENIEILRVKPRFGPPKNLNDVIVHYKWNDMMICELRIQLM